RARRAPGLHQRPPAAHRLPQGLDLDVKMRGARLVTIAACLVASLARTASADRRAFAHTFQYGTEAPGETSLVAWYTETRPSWTGDVAGLELRMQIQHGITEHWDAAVYGVFTQLATGVPGADLALGLSEVR